MEKRKPIQKISRRLPTFRFGQSTEESKLLTKALFLGIDNGETVSVSPIIGFDVG